MGSRKKENMKAGKVRYKESDRDLLRVLCKSVGFGENRPSKTERVDELGWQFEPGFLDDREDFGIVQASQSHHGSFQICSSMVMRGGIGSNVSGR